jgi:hypothetical protein
MKFFLLKTTSCSNIYLYLQTDIGIKTVEPIINVI